MRIIEICFDVYGSSCLNNNFSCAAWQEAVTLVPVRSVEIDIGQNLTVACAEEDALPQSGESVGVMWIREGREDRQIERLKVEPNGALDLINVSADDAGNYSCTLDDDRDAVKTRINVQVNSESLSFQVYLRYNYVLE